MFTGEIKNTGTIQAIKTYENIRKLKIQINQTHHWQIKNGDSIAIDGVCLTVTNSNQQYICVEVMPETLERTTLKHVRINQQVNLEPALLASE